MRLTLIVAGKSYDGQCEQASHEGQWCLFRSALCQNGPSQAHIALTYKYDGDDSKQHDVVAELP